MRDETPSQTVGPFLAIGLPWDDGPVADPDGVRVAGRVLDGAGEPSPTRWSRPGRRDPPAFARCPTDDDGGWHVLVPPAPYVAVHVFARGLLRHLTTRICFDAVAAIPCWNSSRPTAVRRCWPSAPTMATDSTSGSRASDETVFFDV